MHQKHPPAKMAVFVSAEREMFAPTSAATTSMQTVNCFMQLIEMSLLSEANTEIVPENFFAPLDLPAIYGRNAPLEVDLGCGDGAFLVALAEGNPERNFLGIERLAGRTSSARKKIARLGLTNARVLRSETSYVVRHLLPPDSAAVFHLLFPDPW